MHIYLFIYSFLTGKTHAAHTPVFGLHMGQGRLVAPIGTKFCLKQSTEFHPHRYTWVRNISGPRIHCAIFTIFLGFVGSSSES